MDETKANLYFTCSGFNERMKEEVERKRGGVKGRHGGGEKEIDRR